MLNLLKNIHVFKAQNLKKTLLEHTVRVRNFSTSKSGQNKGLISTIKNVWNSHPLISNCITYGILYSGSEFIQQTILRNVADDGKVQDYDIATIFRSPNFTNDLHRPLRSLVSP